MAKVIVQSTSEGVMVSAETLRKAGLSPGGLIEVEVSPLPDAAEITRRALLYCAWKLGDALGAGAPRWTGEEWEVPIYAPGGQRVLGALYLDAHGEVLPEKAPTYDDLLKADDAARTTVPAA